MFSATFSFLLFRYKFYQGFVVVETNFRMYAYSTSKLHCEILRLFARYVIKYLSLLLINGNLLFCFCLKEILNSKLTIRVEFSLVLSHFKFHPHTICPSVSLHLKSLQKNFLLFLCETKKCTAQFAGWSTNYRTSLLVLLTKRACIKPF